MYRETRGWRAYFALLFGSARFGAHRYWNCQGIRFYTRKPIKIFDLLCKVKGDFQNRGDRRDLIIFENFAKDIFDTMETRLKRDSVSREDARTQRER